MRTTWITIVVTAFGTFAMRASFLVAAHRLGQVPPRVQRLLRQIPAAALASLVLPALVRPDGVLDPFGPEAFAGALAALIAWRTRNAALTLVVGLAALVVLESIGV